MITQKINKIALLIAASSFILGTILLIWYTVTRYHPLIDVGLLYVLVAFVLNGITLIGLIVNAIINQHQFKENMTTILLLLLNLPITYVYFIVAFGLIL